MKLEEILDEWQIDSKIDSTCLDTESLKIPNLHHKYLKIFSSENLLLKKLNFQYKELELKKYEYYSGKMEENELKELGWEPFNFKVIKQDLSRYIEGDYDLVQLKLKIDYQVEKTETVKSILHTINNRAFQINNAIKWNMFLNGQ